MDQWHKWSSIAATLLNMYSVFIYGLLWGKCKFVVREGLLRVQWTSETSQNTKRAVVFHYCSVFCLFCLFVFCLFVYLLYCLFIFLMLYFFVYLFLLFCCSFCLFAFVVVLFFCINVNYTQTSNIALTLAYLPTKEICWFALQWALWSILR